MRRIESSGHSSTPANRERDRSANEPRHLMVLWHMHQPQYRDPATGQYVLPWTRLHALKTTGGWFECWRNFPALHATFNVVPSLGVQLEEYASGHFDEPWFATAFRPRRSDAGR